MKTLCIDASDSGQLVVSGADRVRFVHSMCTANIETLGEGNWVRACVLNPKGRVLSIIEVKKRLEDLLVVCPPGLYDATLDMFDAHAIADDVEFARAEGPLSRVWADVAAVWEAMPILGPPEGPVASAEEIEVRRIEAGFPAYGVDVTDANFPFETPLIRHVDMHKGCYTGQEPVARVIARGSAQKQLVGLRLEGDGPAAAGDEIAVPEKERGGRVTSSVVSPDFGPIALAYVHRSAIAPGTAVTVAGDRRARVAALPFSPL